MDAQTKITTMLDALAEMYAQRDLLSNDRQRAIDAILTPELQAQIAAVNLEFAGQAEALGANIAELETAVKTDVKNFGASFKGNGLHAVYMNGRVSWDTKRLEGYAIAHPEIAAFRNVGEPSVSIRRIPV